MTTGVRPRDEQRLRARLTDLAAEASQAETRAVAEEALRALDGCGRFSA
ncbi:hypothetical protein O3S80_05090 [Streptomyces sp. Lzd4kr]|nr:hypothetical protein [Streptomyces sp. Lzd4kr]